MIGRIEGLLVEVSDNVLLIDVGGVGYEVEVSHNVLTGLPGRDQRLCLYTHFVVREDAQQLYGFASRAERDLFRLYIRITGVGPRLAMALISSVTLPELAASVRAGQVDVLKRVPGVGRKTAERLLVELKDKLPQTIAPALKAVHTGADAAEQEAAGALVALGYRPAEASRLVESIRTEGETVEELVRAALRKVARQTEAAS